MADVQEGRIGIMVIDQGVIAQISEAARKEKMPPALVVQQAVQEWFERHGYELKLPKP